MKMNRMKQTLGWLLILVASALELGCISFYRGDFGIYGSPLLLLLSGLIVGITFLFFSRKQSWRGDPKSTLSNHYLKLFDIVIIGVGIYFCWAKLNYWIDLYPFTIFSEGKGSDVIPQIRVMGNRFVNGEFPYEMITAEDWKYGHQLFPTYLPLTWMPFMVAEWLNMDYRIFAFGIFILGFLFFYWKIIAPNPNIWLRLISCSSPFLFLYVFLANHTSLALAVETFVVGFYLLLATSLFSKKIYWLIIGLVLCLLSRYAIILYVPLLLLVWGFKNGWKQMFTISIAVTGAILLIYIIPFLSKEPTIFSQSHNYHTKAALSMWERSEKAGVISKKSIFSAGLGMAIFLVNTNEQPIQEKFKIYQKLHFYIGK